jgi:hypothetical protein
MLWLSDTRRRGAIETCFLCLWEQDASVNATPALLSVPNQGYSLIQGRVAFERHLSYRDRHDPGGWIEFFVGFRSLKRSIVRTFLAALDRSDASRSILTLGIESATDLGI